MKQLMAELFEIYYKDVYSYLYSLCRDASLAEDLSSEVFLELIRSIYSFRGNSDVKTWLFTIARRRWFAYLRRKRQRPPTQSLQELYAVAADETDAETKAAADRIRQLLAQEPELTRRVVQLRLEGYAYYEIAQRLHISESSARVIYFRAKRKIRNDLEKEGFRYE